MRLRKAQEAPRTSTTPKSLEQEAGVDARIKVRAPRRASFFVIALALLLAAVGVFITAVVRGNIDLAGKAFLAAAASGIISLLLSSRNPSGSVPRRS
jgi:hypothetical protein